MLTLLKPGFPHRHNDNGTHDSICTGCFVTVATVLNEPELARFESAHICNPVRLNWFRQSAQGHYEARAAVPLQLHT
jgi:hypothetical protein